MFCLWNEEYGEHDLSYVPGLDETLKRQDEQYKKHIGCVVGDFTCVKVEYDWGRRDQRWTVRCNLCGKEIYQYHTSDWRKGKGRKTTCSCRAERLAEEKQQAQNARLEKIEQNKKEQLGNTYGDWKVIQYTGVVNCKVECVECGKTKKAKIDEVVGGILPSCNHKKPLDFCDDKWIGKRSGHLTVIGRNGSDFVARCDCGNEIIVKPTFMFTYKSRNDCGSSTCPYSTPLERKARECREKGFKFEADFEKILISKGYNAEKTQDQADYGVDIIIYNKDGSKTAVQCKKQSDPAGVDSIQEVYAGGRFYDCTKFAVICDKGFTNPAITMASKLGVYLCEGEFLPPADIAEYAENLLPTYHSNRRNEKLYEVDGVKHTLADWCALYGIPQTDVKRNLKRGLTFEVALIAKPPKQRKEYTVRGFKGNLTEICNHYGVIQQTVLYRMKQRGMSLEEAIFTPIKK